MILLQVVLVNVQRLDVIFVHYQLKFDSFDQTKEKINYLFYFFFFLEENNYYTISTT